MSDGWEPWPTMAAAGRGREPKRKRSRGGWEALDLPSSGGVQKRASSSGSSAMAPPSAPDLTVADADALDCGVCYLPLKPPIFQCDVGHVVCAPCRDKLEATGKCHVCGVAMAGGYRRCHAMERVVDSVRGRCPNAPYGCDATPAYHGRDKHLRACPHAPCHCPGEACGFVGSRAALLGHISAHGWPCTTEVDANDDGEREYTLRLQDGFNFLLADCPTGYETSQEVTATGQCLLLLNVVRQPFGRTISVVWIDSHAVATDVRGGEGRPASKEMECYLWYYQSWRRYDSNHHSGNQVLNYSQGTTFRVACTDLSNGMPNSDGCFQFVSSSVTVDHDNGGIGIEVKFSILSSSSE